MNNHKLLYKIADQNIKIKELEKAVVKMDIDVCHFNWKKYSRAIKRLEKARSKLYKITVKYYKGL